MADFGDARLVRADDRHRRVAALIADERADDGISGLVGSLQRLCRAATKQLPVTGAAVNLMSDTGSEGVAAGSDERIERIDELQFSMGEGPCRDAFASRRPVLVADLSSRTSPSWPGYTPAATTAGIGAVFAFPLFVGAIGFGVLDLFADGPVALTLEQLRTALTYAEIAMETIMEGNATTSDGNLDPDLESAQGYRAQIYQAQGMVMVDLGVSLAEALARMRAHAYVRDRRLADVASDIIADRTRLDRDG